jgi:hypothetical protein
MSSRDWVIPKLLENDSVDGALPLKDIFVEIHSKKGQTLVAAVIPDRLVTRESVLQALSHEVMPDILVTIPIATVWTGAAINCARENELGWGGMGELRHAIDSDDVSSIQKKEYDFVERGLGQHDKVSHLERLYDRVYVVHRTNYDPITVTLINEYELTADHIRHARDTYGRFDAVLKTNPNGNTTSNAIEVAEQLSIGIYKWGEFLGRLHKP